MKSKAFQNKGMRFIKDMGLFQIEVEIQSQRYYKEEHTENFRINYFLFCREFTELSGRKLRGQRIFLVGKLSFKRIA